MEIYEFGFWWLLFWGVALTFVNWRRSYQVAFYEAWLERLEAEAGVSLPKSYSRVKSDFWAFIK